MAEAAPTLHAITVRRMAASVTLAAVAITVTISPNGKMSYRECQGRTVFGTDASADDHTHDAIYIVKQGTFHFLYVTRDIVT